MKNTSYILCIYLAFFIFHFFLFPIIILQSLSWKILASATGESSWMMEKIYQ